MQVVLLNGPKGVGKSTAALAMVKGDWFIEPVVAEAKLQTLAFYQIDPSLLPIYESVKDQPLDEFHGLTFRDAIIANTERVGRLNIVKAWTKRVRDTMTPYVDTKQVVVVPDVRFFEEFCAAVDLVGGKNVYLMRIFRPGHDFTGDVGGYIRTDIANFGNVECSIYNDQDVEFFKLETTVFAHGFVARARDDKDKKP